MAAVVGLGFIGLIGFIWVYRASGVYRVCSVQGCHPRARPSKSADRPWPRKPPLSHQGAKHLGALCFGVLGERGSGVRGLGFRGLGACDLRVYSFRV